jgi:hypothetical protein
MKRYDAEIDSFFKIYLICSGIGAGMIVRCGIRGHFNTTCVVIDPGKSKDENDVYTQGYQDEKEDFAGFETKTHSQGQMTIDK